MTHHEDLEPLGEPEPSLPVSLPYLQHLAELLGELDEFLRSGTNVILPLTQFMQHRRHTNPGLAAYNLIDDLCFTAYGLRRRIENIPNE
jgi:hypothetical protein